MVTKDAEESNGRRRLLDRDPQMVHQALRARPFPVVARLNELVVGDEIGGRSRLPDLDEEFGGRGGIQLHVLLKIELLAPRIDAAVVVSVRPKTY